MPETRGDDVTTDCRQATISMVMDALGGLSLPPPDLAGIRARLLAGCDSPLVNELGLDSLGAMEFCIHLELEAGLVVTPEDLLITRSTQSLLFFLESKVKDAPDVQAAS